MHKESTTLQLLTPAQKEFVEQNVVNGVDFQFLGQQLDEMFFDYIGNPENESPGRNGDAGLAYRALKRTLSYIDSKLSVENGEVILTMQISI